MRSHLLPVMLCTILALPLPAAAATAISCHCFTERSYDPARPTVADPYFLATAQNSFFATVFGLEKRAVVMKKQQGVSGDDLWIAHWAAARAGVTPDDLLQRKGSWKDTLAKLRLIPPPGPRTAAALALKNPTDTALAEAVVDDLLQQHGLLPEAELTSLRRERASNQEVILATLLALKTGQPPGSLRQRVKSGNASWGLLLQQAKLEPSAIQGEFASRLKKAK
jgi:hypothetical protein